MFVVMCFSVLFAQELRPVRDDIGFCWQAGQIERLVDYLKTSFPDKEDPGRMPALIAGISPHDDYLYAGRVYYPLFKRIKAKEVVIFGVTHSTVRKKIGDPQDRLIFDEYKFWRGPYKNIEISPLREFLKKKLDKNRCIVSNEAHRLEHSIEAMLPFLQYYNRDVKITPVMVTGMNFENMQYLAAELATHIAAYIKENHLEIGKDIFFLISADANHYGKAFDNTAFGEDESAHQLATGSDRKIAAMFLSGEISEKKPAGLTEQLWGKTYKHYGDRVWCGKFSIPFGMLTVLSIVEKTAPGKTLTGKILLYSDTYSEGVLPLKKPGYGITAPFSLKHWVGFFSAGYFLE